jgi:hypothetical protein
MVFNATFNNISAISWRSILLVEETGVPWENHWPAASHGQTLSHNDIEYTSPERDSNSQNVYQTQVWRPSTNMVSIIVGQSLVYMFIIKTIIVWLEKASIVLTEWISTISTIKRSMVWQYNVSIGLDQNNPCQYWYDYLVTKWMFVIKMITWWQEKASIVLVQVNLCY